jgi:hypothetical protein
VQTWGISSDAPYTCRQAYPLLPASGKNNQDVVMRITIFVVGDRSRLVKGYSSLVRGIRLGLYPQRRLASRVLREGGRRGSGVLVSAVVPRVVARVGWRGRMRHEQREASVRI